MNSTLRKRFSYVLIGGGIVLLALAVLLLIATYQHNAAVAAEVEAAQEAITHSAEMTNGSDEDAAERAQELAEIEALAEESRGSYMPSAVLLLVGAGGLLAGVRIYRSSGSAGGDG
ncbi:hypothetical protein [Aquisalimonas asiatica]|uniref:Uncharacterized protein n=1 Tax=Aquisalimonas asiatica TaxID=406100 RepID=A0A1H8SKT4_9GAMM|nr:hypothetical protein [Aquisalimonas asiatica]SEO79579.1 hypothetical protein SAMN04488052_10357 [Aquisalimonas asiatica]